MSVSHEQLSEIYRQLKEYFRSHPAITLRPIKGDPPDQYEITYNIAGFSKPGKGEATLTTGHTVEMTIPFGFPHFPPSCKPKSDIYHPDFDPAAICLGDFWEQSGQLPDLIIFIGKLINGESYSTANAFNEEAAVWYQEHTASFPIAQINWGDRPPPHSLPDIPDNNSQIDTLDDADLSPDFNFLALERSDIDEDVSLDTSVREVEPPSGVDLGFLQLLENQKKFYKLREIIRGHSSPSALVQKMTLHTEEAIKQAEGLQRSAKKTEDQGDLRKALRFYEQIFTIIADFPDVEADISRIKHALTLLEETTQDDTPEDGVPDFYSNGDQHENKLPVPKLTTKRNNIRKTPVSSTQTRASFSEKLFGSNKLITYLLTGALVITLGYCGFYYFRSVHRLNTADTAFNLCSTLLENGQYDGAKESCDSGLETLREIKFVHQEKVKLLESDINKILQSEKLTQGLAGNFLIDGQYLPKKDFNTLNEFRQMLKEAEELFDQENWEQAAEKFTKSLTIADKSTHIPPDIIADINDKLKLTKFRMVYGSAKTLLANHKWQEAAVELNKAQNLLDTIPAKNRKYFSGELRSRLAECNFEDFRKQGEDFFAKSEWLNAISAYNSALLAADESYVVPQEIVEAIHENITRSELYVSIDKGNKAFASVAWDEAIKEYNKAGAILTDNRGLLKLTDTKVNRRKIDRIVLQAAIIRDRQAARIQQEEKKNLVAAMKLYRQIIASINNSAFATEGEFVEAKKETVATIQALDEKIFEADKEQYLKDNFRTIFIANYPTAIPENLTNPTISYVRETDGKMIFKMQCTESGGGRPLTLVMFYAYEKIGNRWSLFSENQ